MIKNGRFVWQPFIHHNTLKKKSLRQNNEIIKLQLQKKIYVIATAQ